MPNPPSRCSVDERNYCRHGAASDLRSSEITSTMGDSVEVPHPAVSSQPPSWSSRPAVRTPSRSASSRPGSTPPSPPGNQAPSPPWSPPPSPTHTKYALRTKGYKEMSEIRHVALLHALCNSEEEQWYHYSLLSHFRFELCKFCTQSGYREVVEVVQHFDCSHLQILVLHEADQMLHRNPIQICRYHSQILKAQTLLFSVVQTKSS